MSRVLFITGDDVIMPNVSISGVTIRHGGFAPKVLNSLDFRPKHSTLGPT